jgi:geranylgeranyl diphosphate synthase type I
MNSDTGIPDWLLGVITRVDDRLRGFLAEEQAHWTAINPELVDPFRALEVAVLAGGKRLRPAFCYLGWLSAGGDPEATAPADELGAAFELLHAFALVHDDVMDDAPLRRGHPTTHVAFEDRHATEGWRGDGRLFGQGMAILVGDLAHVYAGSIVARMPPVARARWREMQLELMAGQYLDLLSAARAEVDGERARLIARLKTGRYSIEQPLLLGASLASETPSTPGSPSPLDEVLVAYGSALGMAFQLRDDVLGAFGDPAVTGKPVGDDLRTGKATLLLARGLEEADGAQREILAGVGDLDATDDDIALIQGALRDSGALAAVEAEIAELAGVAREAVGRADIPSEASAALTDLVGLVAFRAT